MPWTDHAGKLSHLKAACLLFCLYPALLLLARWQAGGAIVGGAIVGGLGSRPITEAIHFSGDWTVRFLILALAVTPARAVLDWPRVLLLRRMLGVTAALYAGLHLTLYCADMKWDPGVVVSEIVLRFYLTIGFVTLLGLATLAWTSTDNWQKRLRQRWKTLHRWVYPLVGLALFHYALQAKINAVDAIFWFGVFIWLMLWRALKRPQQRRLAVLAALAPLAALATAATEIAWYGLATKVPVWRVFQANLAFDPTVRPAAQVLVLGLAVVALAALRRVPWSRAKPPKAKPLAPASLRPAQQQPDAAGIGRMGVRRGQH